MLPSTSTQPLDHRIGPDETLNTVCIRCKTTPATLAALNPALAEYFQSREAFEELRGYSIVVAPPPANNNSGGEDGSDQTVAASSTLTPRRRVRDSGILLTSPLPPSFSHATSHDSPSVNKPHHQQHHDAHHPVDKDIFHLQHELDIALRSQDHEKQRDLLATVREAQALRALERRKEAELLKLRRDAVELARRQETERRLKQQEERNQRQLEHIEREHSPHPLPHNNQQDEAGMNLQLQSPQRPSPSPLPASSGHHNIEQITTKIVVMSPPSPHNSVGGASASPDRAVPPPHASPPPSATSHEIPSSSATLLEAATNDNVSMIRQQLQSEHEIRLIELEKASLEAQLEKQRLLEAQERSERQIQADESFRKMEAAERRVQDAEAAIVADELEHQRDVDRFDQQQEEERRRRFEEQEGGQSFQHQQRTEATLNEQRQREHQYRQERQEGNQHRLQQLQETHANMQTQFLGNNAVDLPSSPPALSSPPPQPYPTNSKTPPLSTESKNLLAERREEMRQQRLEKEAALGQQREERQQRLQEEKEKKLRSTYGRRLELFDAKRQKEEERRAREAERRERLLGEARRRGDSRREEQLLLEQEKADREELRQRERDEAALEKMEEELGRELEKLLGGTATARSSTEASIVSRGGAEYDTKPREKVVEPRKVEREERPQRLRVEKEERLRKEYERRLELLETRRQKEDERRAREAERRERLLEEARRRGDSRREEQLLREREKADREELRQRDLDEGTLRKLEEDLDKELKQLEIKGAVARSAATTPRRTTTPMCNVSRHHVLPEQRPATSRNQQPSSVSSNRPERNETAARVKQEKERRALVDKLNTLERTHNHRRQDLQRQRDALHKSNEARKGRQKRDLETATRQNDTAWARMIENDRMKNDRHDAELSKRLDGEEGRLVDEYEREKKVLEASLDIALSGRRDGGGVSPAPCAPPQTGGGDASQEDTIDAHQDDNGTGNDHVSAATEENAEGSDVGLEENGDNKVAHIVKPQQDDAVDNDESEKANEKVGTEQDGGNALPPLIVEAVPTTPTQGIVASTSPSEATSMAADPQEEPDQSVPQPPPPLATLNTLHQQHQKSSLNAERRQERRDVLASLEKELSVLQQQRLHSQQVSTHTTDLTTGNTTNTNASTIGNDSIAPTEMSSASTTTHNSSNAVLKDVQSLSAYRMEAYKTLDTAIVKDLNQQRSEALSALDAQRRAATLRKIHMRNETDEVHRMAKLEQRRAQLLNDAKKRHRVPTAVAGTSAAAAAVSGESLAEQEDREQEDETSSKVLLAELREELRSPLVANPEEGATVVLASSSMGTDQQHLSSSPPPPSLSPPPPAPLTRKDVVQRRSQYSESLQHEIELASSHHAAQEEDFDTKSSLTVNGSSHPANTNIDSQQPPLVVGSGNPNTRYQAGGEDRIYTLIIAAGNGGHVKKTMNAVRPDDLAEQLETHCELLGHEWVSVLNLDDTVDDGTSLSVRTRVISSIEEHLSSSVAAFAKSGGGADMAHCIVLIYVVGGWLLASEERTQQPRVSLPSSSSVWRLGFQHPGVVSSPSTTAGTEVHDSAILFSELSRLLSSCFSSLSATAGAGVSDVNTTNGSSGLAPQCILAVDAMGVVKGVPRSTASPSSSSPIADEMRQQLLGNTPRQVNENETSSFAIMMTAANAGDDSSSSALQTTAKVIESSMQLFVDDQGRGLSVGDVASFYGHYGCHSKEGVWITEDGGLSDVCVF